MRSLYVLLVVCGILFSCQSPQSLNNKPKLRILIDTDANNELDDQHALAYAFLNHDIFDVAGITVNNTWSGSGIDEHCKEAMRIIKLFDLEENISLLKGAEGNYDEILPTIQNDAFDGKEAVDFIIKEVLKSGDEKLILVPIGKLTNIALAIKKAPAIVDKVKVVWLGSNYPNPGEYNLNNDTTSVNPVIESGVEFEMVTVRYGDPSGTAAVTVEWEEVVSCMKGKGPKSKNIIEGRHGGKFSCFGDYSVNLFEHVRFFGDPPSRPLFDMAAIAILKNESWAEKNKIPAPRLKGNQWIDQPLNPNKITLWENFDRDAIVNDLFELMEKSSSD